MTRFLLKIIDLYQTAISPFMGHCCRFFPTCSDYAKEAIIKYGVCKGCWKTACRLAKCHPFHPGGEDPV